jgi:hypothetical protein
LAGGQTHTTHHKPYSLEKDFLVDDDNISGWRGYFSSYSAEGIALH